MHVYFIAVVFFERSDFLIQVPSKANNETRILELFIVIYLEVRQKSLVTNETGKLTSNDCGQLGTHIAGNHLRIYETQVSVSHQRMAKLYHLVSSK